MPRAAKVQDASFFSEIDLSKSATDANGHLMVYGKATGSDLDLDGQRMDPKWLAKAMPEWLPFGNIREQHGKVAAGVGMELDQKGDDWYVKALIVDKGTIEKIKAKVLKGFSINVRDATVTKSTAAPNGVIGGDKAYIGEISVVDRPCLPSATMDVVAKSIGICKAASAEAPLTAEDAPAPAPVVDDETLDDADANAEPDTLEKALARIAELEKRDFSPKQRKAAANAGTAMPDGSFPIQNTDDLANAVKAVGRASDPGAARAHIKRRAKALGVANPFKSGPGAEKSVASLDKASGGGATVDDITKAVDKAKAEIVAEYEVKLAKLGTQLDKVLATPIPGAPVIMGAPGQSQNTKATPSRKAEYLQRASIAKAAGNLDMADTWEEMAAEQPD